MWSYLKAAFWARADIPGLGQMPLNAMLLCGLGLLGFGHQGFWLAAIALETSYLYILATNERFQNLVNSENHEIEDLSVEMQRLTLVQGLIPPRRAKIERLDQKCDRILQLDRDRENDGFIVEGSGEALRKIQWLYLKLLVAEQNIDTLQTPSVEHELQKQIDLIQCELTSSKITNSLKESKNATLQILHQRLANLERREQILEEITSDLTRIEAQVDLAIENTGMRGRNETISTNIKLVSQLLDNSVYGESEASIAAIDQTYGEKA